MNITTLKVFKILGFSFAGFGLLFVIIGLSVGIGMKNSYEKFIESAVKTTAVISDITYDIIPAQNYNETSSRSYNVFVTFNTEIRENITAKLDYYSSSMKIGQTIEIYYDPLNPYHIESGSPMYWLFLLIFSGVGFIFVILGGIFIVVSFRQDQRVKMLIDGGHYVMAEIVDAQLNYSVRINGRYPFVIQCEYEDGNGKYFFESGDIFMDPRRYIGEKIKVWVEKEYYGNYYVDLNSLYKTKIVN